MQLKFYGAAGEVTGSCHIVTVQGRTLLIDCGLIQGGDDPDARNREPFPFDAVSIDAVILSHAHIDHCGRLPLLRKRGFDGPIHATRACRELAKILLADSAHMNQRDAERANRHRGEPRRGAARRLVEPLFDADDAARTMEQFVTVPYDTATDILPGVRATYRDAGHILGSASVLLELEEDGERRRVLFSGDIGQYDSPILRDPGAADTADVVVMESTYGDRQHRERDDTLEEFGRILLEARRGGGNVLIPAFAVGRSQEILYELALHFDAWRLADWQIFLDSPMAIEASAIYWRHPELFDAEAKTAYGKAQALPPLPNLTLCRTADESMKINNVRSGAIVIAGSGMCTGGRIVHHLRHNLARPECNVIFTGFQAVGTLGRSIVDRREFVRILGDAVPVRARVHTLGGFSAHGDQADLLRWHTALGGHPQTWLVHGEAKGADGLRAALAARGIDVHVAQAGQQLELSRAHD